METISAEEILNGAGDRAGLRRDEIDGDLFKSLRGFLSRRLREGWRATKWPDLVRCEKRFFRRMWTATDAGLLAVAAGEERYSSQVGNYFQSLFANGVSPVDSDGETNLTAWAECAASYSADDWDSTADYAIGDQVYYPETDRFYQCWATAAAGVLPSDTDHWGVLTDFERSVAYEQTLAGGALAVGVPATAIGDVFGVWESNPRGDLYARPVPWVLTSNGIVVRKPVSFVWIEFLLRAPVLKGDVYDATSTYAVGEQVYFEGDFYNCVSAAAVLESPSASAAKWSIKEIPLFLERWLVSAVYADYLEMEWQKEKAAVELGSAKGLLEDEAFVVAQQTDERMEVRS